MKVNKFKLEKTLKSYRAGQGIIFYSCDNNDYSGKNLRNRNRYDHRYNE